MKCRKRERRDRKKERDAFRSKFRRQHIQQHRLWFAGSHLSPVACQCGLVLDERLVILAQENMLLGPGATSSHDYDLDILQPFSKDGTVGEAA